LPNKKVVLPVAAAVAALWLAFHDRSVEAVPVLRTSASEPVVASAPP
jgi:hypothetical protein